MSLGELLAKPIGQAGAEFFRFLESDVVLDQVESRLPDYLKGQSRRLVAAAKDYFTKNVKASRKFSECTCKSLVECICEAADYGFALDGRNCYAVPRGSQATFQPSYLGMLNVAKRLKLIDDGWARVVMPQDAFELRESDGVQTYRFEPDIDTPREFAAMRGVLAVSHLQGRVRWEWLTKPEIESLRGRSKAANDGPWVTDPEEMSKAKALRRLLKTLSDDPAMSRLFAADDAASDFQDLLARPVRSGRQRAVGDVFGGAYLPEPEPAQAEQQTQEASGDAKRR